MTRKQVVRLVISLSILVAAIWWALRGVDLGNVAAILGQSDIILVLLCVPMIVLSHVVRGHRWTLLLRPASTTVPLSAATSSVLIGYAANNIIPRSGEFIRPWVLSRRLSIPYGTTVTSIIVERIIDVLSLVLGISIVSLVANDVIIAAIPSFTIGRVMSVIVVPALAVAFAIGIIAYTEAGAWAIERVVRPWRAGLADRLHETLETIRTGLRAIGQPRLYAGLILDSGVIWLLWALPILLCYHAIPHQHPVPFDLADAFIMLLIVSIGATIAPTPGALGVYQSFAQGALMILYGADKDEAMAFAMLTWMVNYLLILGVGAVALAFEVRAGLAWQDLVDSSRKA